MHLIGFIIRIYHDARSPESQIRVCACLRAKAVHHHGRKYNLKISKTFRMIIELAMPNLIEIGPWERGRKTGLLSHWVMV